MIQIISNSNETSTGPELVQNGNFSQLGADLVENGLFDELGTDVITNGSFTGVTELVTNGDFSNGTNNWTPNANATLTIDNNKLKVAISGGSGYPSQSVTTEIGKTYKVTADAFIGTSSRLAVYNNADSQFRNLYADGSFDFTITATSTSTQLRLYVYDNGAYGLWDNVSVKEEGEDWTNGIGWSFGEDKAISTQALGSEEVTNGDFSAAGINLVDNPNFTDTGSELITNGDFATDTDWGVIYGGTIVSNEMVLDCGATTNAYTDQFKSTPYTLGASYQITIDIVSNTTGTPLVLYPSTNAPNTSVLTIGTSATTHTITFTPDYTSGTGKRFVLRALSSTGTLVIDNVSVKELGADWTFNNGASVGEDKAIISGDGSLFGYIEQTTVFESGKSYKVTLDAVITTGGGLNVKYGLSYADNIGSITETSSPTFYYTAAANSSLIIGRSTGGVAYDSSVTNISVQELGEGWTTWTSLDGEVSIDANGARIKNGASAGNAAWIQAGVFVTDKSYKFSYTIVSNTDLNNYLNLDDYQNNIPNTVGNHEIFITGLAIEPNLQLKRAGQANTDIVITNVSVKEIATSYLTQAVSLSAKTWKIIYSVSDYLAGSVSATDYGAVTTANAVGITEYVQIGVASDFRMVNIDGYFEGAVTDISAQLVDPNGYWYLNSATNAVSIGEDKAIFTNASSGNNIQQIGWTIEVGKYYKCTFDIPSISLGKLRWMSGSGLTISSDYTASATSITFYFQGDGSNGIYCRAVGTTTATLTNISVEQLDPNDYWTLGMGWSIGTDKAISTVTGSNSDITQSILTAGKTYRTVYEIVDYDAGTAQAVVTGSEGADAVAIETYTEDLTTTGTDFSIRSKLGTFDGSVSSVSAKLLGSYSDQSIYVTAADVQTIAQASVYYLVELTSMGSENSLYFLPSSVVANNGRYTKLNFTVVSKDALTQPTVGIISFYDSAGGFDTYPMGFYEFKIYEQTSSTNLDPLLATGLLEKGFAFVRDFSGNMQELTDGFKEYNPTLTQYVYSK